MFSIYPLERIKKEYDEHTDKDFIPFCDYLVNSHQIGLYKKNKRVFKKYENSYEYLNDKVADDFKASMIEILLNSENIY
ncbi:hypothetical protein [Flammeovirga sp. OC4]|uniref:hypothetical protein n=1 Tax=Flammeovirga sp. OC4 TaxID=1382345 RepID=UPI0005C52572|nr:hypothetical protein [Flammeovirga sp. OC4]